KRKRWRSQSTLECGVGEQAAAQIVEEVVRLEHEVRDDKIQKPVPIVIAEVGAHSGSGLSVTGHRDTSQQPDLFEYTAAFVAVEDVWRQVVGHENVGPAVVVVVPGDDSQSLSRRGENARLLADIGKRPIAVVVIENVRETFVELRTAI